MKITIKTVITAATALAVEDHRVYLALREYPDHKANRDQQGHRDQPDHRANKDRKAYRAHKA